MYIIVKVINYGESIIVKLWR